MKKHEFDALSREVIRCAIDVHVHLGPGFMERSYRRALRIALTTAAVSYSCEYQVRVLYRGSEVGNHRLDLLVENQLIVELKAIKQLAPVHFAQLRAYLRAADLKVGLLINFNAPTLEVRRIVNGFQHPNHRQFLIS